MAKGAARRIAFAGACAYGDGMADLTDTPLAELRMPLVAAMLPHVAFDGWSAAARDAGARDAGIDPDIAVLVLPDAAAMVDAYTARADARMTEAMAAAGVAAMKIRDRIRLAVRTRLEQADAEKEAVRRALAVLALHPALGTRILWRTAGAMWRAAGDTATDYNHYTKRLTLGAVYSTTLLHWLDDHGAGHDATWAFLDRRIDGVMRFEKAKARAIAAMGVLPDPARFLGRLRYPTR